MRGKTLLILICLFIAKASQGQKLFFEPEMLVGHRSTTYLHIANYDFNDRLSINNLTLFDTEYTNDSNNVFFIRNTAAYKLANKITVNAAFGIKNPGHFVTTSVMYRYAQKLYSLSYSVGTTYQNGFSLEQSFAINYAPQISTSLKAYFNLLIIANIDTEEYQRGLQQFRLGLMNKRTKYGAGVNFDQFNNSSKTLSNIGLFIKHNFKTH